MLVLTKISFREECWALGNNPMKFWDFPDIGSVLFCRSLWMFSVKAYIKHVWNFSVNNRVNFKSKRLFDRKNFWKNMKSILRVLNMKILFLMLNVRYRFRHIYINQKRTRKNSVFGHFSRSAALSNFWNSFLQNIHRLLLLKHN